MSPAGSWSPAAMYALHASVEIVKPGGTGNPMFVISARLAPLPPSRYFCSRPPSSKAYTNFRLLGGGFGHHGPPDTSELRIEM